MREAYAPIRPRPARDAARAPAARESRRAAPDRAADDAVSAGLRAFIEASPLPVLLFDADGAFRFFNCAFEALTQRADGSPGARDCAALRLIDDTMLAHAQANGAWHGDVTYGRHVLELHLAPIDGSSAPALFGATFRDVGALRARDEELRRRNAELEAVQAQMRASQEQLIHTEKLASIGQLAAGIAHEINNPMGYVQSNLETLVTYTQHLLALIEGYERVAPAQDNAQIQDMRRRFDIDFVRTDLPQLLAESREGAERVRQIVKDLKDFSRSDASEAWKLADLHRGLDSTLNIVWNELKYKAKLVKHFGNLPYVRCVPSELNQVFLNLLVNAGHAIGDNGTITLRTDVVDGFAAIEIQDDGSGMAPEQLEKIFQPFYTTKPAGKGTGLGLSISQGIVKKHGGRIEVESALGVGTTFRVLLPLEAAAGV